MGGGREGGGEAVAHFASHSAGLLIGSCTNMQSRINLAIVGSAVDKNRIFRHLKPGPQQAT